MLIVDVLSDELEIDLKRGMWRNEPQAARFRFICDRHTEEVCKRRCFYLFMSVTCYLAFPSDVCRNDCRNPHLRVVNPTRVCEGTSQFQRACRERGFCTPSRGRPAGGKPRTSRFPSCSHSPKSRDRARGGLVSHAPPMFFPAKRPII